MFVSKPSSLAKIHRGDMFYISKTLFKLRGVREKKNQGHTTRTSENIEGNVKSSSKIEVSRGFEDAEISTFDPSLDMLVVKVGSKASKMAFLQMMLECVNFHILFHTHNSVVLTMFNKFQL